MKPAGQMTLTLTAELERFVREQAKRGAFASSSEYVRTLIRERYQRETERAERLDALDAAIMQGLSDAEAGRTIELKDAVARLRRDLGLPEA
jgi:antitoxin ParD1/3/4